MPLYKPRLSDPRRLAGVILAVVAVFVVAVVGTLVLKSRAGRVEATGGAASGADLRIKEVELEEVSDGVRWRLRAEEALVFKPEGRTALKKIAVDVFERERSWTIVGEEGELFERTGNVEIRRNVVLTSSDGLRLETSVLRWQGAERRLWTDAPVRLWRDGAVVSGTALDVRTRDDRTTVAGRVRATFTRIPAW
ncbi:MAG: LPS export ABC transporter periplasmic protein LptC [Candidatus Rokuibacteriota bacterium]|nr:MAG: LPS export ABC transporter periplasmic protein LptC [Candidatus Rokubacteria bacterium]PYM64029.1 MAG: LPS export ABC transporter periplasmic protein LptC [Candidatus Rokubacteria bacterium]PYN68123.1 MAG: LPS export ABC transporter periplasmic protein LptC [Candidatus Rokubacteria bacterium]